MTGVFNTKDSSHAFLDKVQFPALVIHNITIYHILWRYLTSIFLHNSTPQWPWNRAIQELNLSAILW